MSIADNIDYDPFDRPTPGQGMTAAPGSRVWEQPSQFSNPKEAVAFVIGKIDSNEQGKDEMLNLMAAGSPIEDFVNTISLSVFSEGKWSPDVAELIKLPVTAYLIGLAMENGIEAQLYNKSADERDSTMQADLHKVMASNRPEEHRKMINDFETLEDESSNEIDEMDAREQEEIAAMTPQDEGGFMPRREVI